ncbi:MAG: sigma-54-dependent Fis family transcriptional regulator [Deltaproteobacteria bacterium GWA2_54_12]|nr:MAG: sigma-54-dependent Fis family transcriptional regulator [Deltaproteobacteria bacterium GWA2_54_12]
MANSLIYIVDDEETIRKLLEHTVTKRWGFEARAFASGEACLDALIDDPDLVLLDIMMEGISGVDTLREARKRKPDLPVIMLSAQGSMEVAIESLKLGASDYFSKPIDFPKLEIAIRNALQLRQVSREMSQLKERIQHDVQFENIVSTSGEMQEVFRLVSKVKNSDIPVLVMGESGTGKELISRAIHFNSDRKDAPFVVVNCASIPHELLESELFGHEKGAFTGAYQRRIGRFEQAHQGTIFLDEIGEMDLALQAKLLRVIQTKEFQRVGGNDTIISDVRLVSATNRDIREEVRQKRFREDLYFRIAAFPIVVPPLRQRKSDILVLAEHFLKLFGQASGKTLRFSREALRLLYDYPWPGNVRELENVIQRGVVMTDGKEITPGDLPVALQTFLAPASASSIPFVESETGVVPLERVKETAIRNALKVTGGNIAEAALRLKLGRATLYRLMKKYKIEM